MKKIVGIGETILDILFKENQPVRAVPGGSSFNGLISLGRMGLPAIFISEIGNDRVGKIIKDYMAESHLTTEYIDTFPDGKSPVSLAFLNAQNDAEYLFYKDYPNNRLETGYPILEADDLVLFGSYYAINPVLRPRMLDLLQFATDRKAIVYYDVNFRSTHANESIRLTPTFIENFEFSDIIRGSVDDFFYMYNTTDMDKVYKEKIQFYTQIFICTYAEKGVVVRTPNFKKQYESKSIQPVSTVGAGDNFNAGILYALYHAGVSKFDLIHLRESDWDYIIECGLDFASEVCQSYENSLSKEFAASYSNKR